MSTRLATVLLVLVTVVWGWTFVIVHDAVALYSVMGFLALRFSLAAIATGLFWGRYLNRRTLGVGICIGLVLATGYLLQTWGLIFTTPTNAGLITGLFVVLAPIFDRMIYHTKLHTSAWLAVAMSVAGMILLTGKLPTNFAFGDILILGCAVAFGVHIAVLSRHSSEHDPRALTTAQMIGLAVLFLVLWPITGEITAPPREVWFALALTGLVASALAYAIQTAAQQVLSAVRTAVILTLEPVFAGFFGIWLAHDRLGPSQLLGAVVILAAVLLSELMPAIIRKRAKSQ